MKKGFYVFAVATAALFVFGAIIASMYFNAMWPIPVFIIVGIIMLVLVPSYHKDIFSERVKTEVKESEEPKGTTLAVDIADMDMYISGKKKFATIKEQLDLIKKAKADPAYNTDANYRDKVNGLEVIKSTEAIKKADEANKTKWRNEYNALSPLQQRKWKKDNPTKAKAIGV